LLYVAVSKIKPPPNTSNLQTTSKPETVLFPLGTFNNVTLEAVEVLVNIL
jgi:hypothetical protein